MQPRPRKLGQHLQVWANEIIHPFNLYQSICIKKGNYSWIIPSLFLSSYFTSLELGNFFLYRYVSKNTVSLKFYTGHAGK